MYVRETETLTLTATRGEFTGTPQDYVFRAVFTTLAEAQAAAAEFPKGAKARAVPHALSEAGTLYLSGNLRADGVNHGVNETAQKRYRTIVKAAAKLGYEISYGRQYTNAYETREAFETAAGVA